MLCSPSYASLELAARSLPQYLGNKIMSEKSKAFNKFRHHCSDYNKNDSKMEDEFYLFKSNDQSEIMAISDNDDEDTKDENRRMTNILSKIDGKDISNAADDREVLHGTIHEEAVESSIGNNDNSNNQEDQNYSNNDDEEKENSRMMFHSKLPLSIDI